MPSDRKLESLSDAELVRENQRLMKQKEQIRARQRDINRIQTERAGLVSVTHRRLQVVGAKKEQ